MRETLGNKSTRLCITVVGSSSVGKTALTVQYLTGRFIGDYYSGADMTYRHSIPYLGGSLTTNVDILDISRPEQAGRPEEEEEDLRLIGNGQWHHQQQQMEKTNAFLVVYSLTDSRSFVRAQQILARLPFNAPKYLVANQLDLQHRRQVTKLEGQTVADKYGCPFDEISAAETLPHDGQHTVKTAFNKLIRQLVSHSHVLPCPRIRFTAFSKLIGAFVSKATRLHAANNKLQRKSSVSSGGSSSSSGSGGSGNSSISDISIATITSETSFMRIGNNSVVIRRPSTVTTPIPIVGRKIVRTNYPLSNHVASI